MSQLSSIRRATSSGRHALEKLMPDGGDGITRYPQDGGGNVISPDEMPDYEDPDQDGKPDDDQKFNDGGTF